MEMNNFFNQNSNRQFTCCICHKVFKGFGNNPRPLVMKSGSRCCDDCNQLVILARLYVMRNLETEEDVEHFERMPLRKKIARMEKASA